MSGPVVVLLPYLSCSGLELFGIRFAQDLLSRNIETIVAAPDQSMIAEQCFERNIPRHEFPEIKKYEPWGFPAALNMINELEPAAVIAFRTQLMYPLHFARLISGKHIPFLLFYRIGAGSLYRNDPLHRRLFKHLTAVVPNAMHVKNKILKFWGIDPEKVVCIHSGVDTNRYQPDSVARCQIRTQLGLTENDLLIGSSGRIHPEKGSEILLRALFDEKGAAKDRSNVHLVYIGREYKPGYIEHLKNVAQELGVTEKFHVLPFRNDIEKFYSALDIFAFAVTSSETYAYVALEALACGVPPIVPYIGGMKEMYEHNVHGWFFEHRNTDSLRKILSRTINTRKSELKKIGLAGREKIIKEASWDIMMQKYLDLFTKFDIRL
ncbi:MAG: glycosyltransferase family 4 protein [Candidatus Rifleibacteriota bacterium]